jgi:arsenite methyltransferase
VWDITDYVAKLQTAGFSQVDVEPWRVYDVADARSFLTQNGIDAEKLAAHSEGTFASAFVRARKAASNCCAPSCCGGK